MEPSFYSQNTSRFYPLDEDKISSVRDTYSECDLDILRQGIVDLGMVVVTDDEHQDSVFSSCTISKADNTYSVVVTADCASDSYQLEFTFENPSDFATIKASNGSNVYGFLTLGLSAVWSRYAVSLIDIPVYRGCIKWLNKRHLRSVEVRNSDRWLPQDECYPDKVPNRPDRWSYGTINAGDIILKAGYNCKITSSERENKIQIQPSPRAGMGEVRVPVGLGEGLIYDEESGEFQPITEQVDAESGRFDTIIGNIRYAKSVAGAYGDHIVVSCDRNFLSQKIENMSESEESESESESQSICPRHVLLISYIRADTKACAPVVIEVPQCEN